MTRADNKQYPFFVYGTLLPDQPNWQLWSQAVIDCKEAVLCGATLYDMGGFPMLIETSLGSVCGCLIVIAPELYQETLLRIDQLEQYDPQDPQSMYRRVLRDVVVADQTVTAWTYIGRADLVAGRTQIGSDWQSYSAERREEIAAWWQQISANTPLIDLISKVDESDQAATETSADG